MNDLDTLLAKQALHELNMAYNRAVDRADEALLRSLWHPDATVDFGYFTGPAAEFCGLAVGATGGLARSFHMAGNEWFDIRGDQAVGEIYSLTLAAAAGADTDSILYGRYLDRYERREGLWKFSHRQYLLDWNASPARTVCWDQGVFALMQHRGGHAPGDAVYGLWNA
ncbi:nuclear transport factor 2 family protein [Niveispirillum sp. BGYR6]|uniref:nuclear transport factor 2 family protein n=1 Tax=Niveispirillum sp. BGYR6 TaxID=2971249 RepID=UPI0022B94DDF|nr:nuclear transport factor 2 family protein [Niveispirillum sp. BGYR6]MDG5496156.1 nuclear transport factor 2 family protein [Niveispirillum sp. BGYR6]